MSFVTVRAAIKTELDSVTLPAAGGFLGCVMNGEQPMTRKDIPKFPAAEIIRVSNEANWMENKSDWITYIFDVNIYQPLMENDDAVEISGDVIVDSLIALFTGASLAGSMRCQPVASEPVIVSWFDRTFRRDTIRIKVSSIVEF